MAVLEGPVDQAAEHGEFVIGADLDRASLQGRGNDRQVRRVKAIGELEADRDVSRSRPPNEDGDPVATTRPPESTATLWASASTSSM